MSMKLLKFLKLFFFLISVVFYSGLVNLGFLAKANSSTISVKEKANKRVNNILYNLPLFFVKNEGQVNKRIKYFAKNEGKNFYFTDSGLYIVLNKEKKNHRNSTIDNNIVQIKFLNTSKRLKMYAAGKLTGKVNFFLGKNPNRWRRNVPVFREIIYKDIYPGISLKFYGNQRSLEYDIVVKPNSDISSLKLEYKGIKDLKIDSKGNLIAILPTGKKIIQKKPIAYQVMEEKKVFIDSSYEILKKKENRFLFTLKLRKYDPKGVLVVDPTITYSSYFGGSDDDHAYGVAVDSNGYAYIVGRTSSLDFMQNSYKGGNSDAFIMKINTNSSGVSSLVYCTFLGGSGTDSGNGIVVDSNGNAYVVGGTRSIDFPITQNAYQGKLASGMDVFLAKLGPSGNLLYSTYFGGFDEDVGKSIAIDNNNNIYITGWTASPDLPMKNSFDSVCGTDGRCTYFIPDAFVAKFNTNYSGESSLIYSAFIGGSSADVGSGISADAEGNVYVTGFTNSQDFILKNAFQENYQGGKYVGDAFVTKLDYNGNLVFSTYLGGSRDEEGKGIAVDKNGNAYVVGDTKSLDFPITQNAYKKTNPSISGIFISKLDPIGNLLYSTYFGGNEYDINDGNAITVDERGNIYITGYTTARDFPITQNAYEKSNPGSAAFVTELEPSSFDNYTLKYSSYLGGNNLDEGYGIAVDSIGDIYVVGDTRSTDFPTVNAYDSTCGTDGKCNLVVEEDGDKDVFFDAFIVKISSDLPSSSLFSDLSPTDWYYTYVQDIANAGITTGYPDGTYRPDVLVTRAQMAAFISRAMKLNTSKQCSGSPFYDVDSSQWYCPYVEALKDAGITSGYSDGSYKPNEYVTRAIMAAFIAKALHLNIQPCTTKPFVDVPTNAWYCPYVQAIKNAGITSGYPDGTYRPDVVVTRAIMAAFIDKAFLKGSKTTQNLNRNRR